MAHIDSPDIRFVTRRRDIGMRRRFIVLGAAAAVAAARVWPADKPRRIGYMGFRLRPKPGEIPAWDAGWDNGFLAALRELGYEEGRDFTFEWKVTEGKPDRLASAAADLAASRVDLIWCYTSAQTLAAKNATRTIPIVFAGLSDPVTSGLVASLAHPSGNITGLSAVDDELYGKRLGLLRELLPRVGSLAVLWNKDTAVHRNEVAQIEALARGLAIDVRPVELSRAEDVGPVFEQLERRRPDAVLVLASHWLANNGAAVLAAATRARLPVVGMERGAAAYGALLTYGADHVDLWRRSAGYVDKIFKGAKPADLPIQQPLKYELVINQKTADAIGVTIPKNLLLLADEVIR